MNEEQVDLALAFLNSRSLHALPDALADPNSIERWMRGEGFVGVDEAKCTLVPALLALAGGVEVTPHDARRARGARDALLALIDGSAHTANLEAVAPALTMRFELTEEGRLEMVPAVRGILAIAALSVAVLAEMQARGRWDRLGRCQNEACGWVYLDRSRNRSKRWCDMRGCGAQAKARAYRARAVSTSSDDAPAAGP